MGLKLGWLLIIATLITCSICVVKEVDLLMPGAVSTKPDELVCHSIQLNSSYHQYITEYIPKASRMIAHHMMIYGCSNPATLAPMWQCGGKEREELDVCGQVPKGKGQMGKRIVYAWANDAPSKKMPEGVGLRVGGDTDIQWMVLQLHYKKQFPEGHYDHSGVTLRITDEKQPNQMGFYILGNWGFIPPQQPAFHLESACPYNENRTIYPFGYRTHAHNLGRITSGYRIRDGEWTEIGRMSPQQPEMFYDVTHPGMDIRNGDVLAGRCMMSSMNRTENTNIGATNKDEMCNFYFMYYTDAEENLDDGYCFRDAQTFHWTDFYAEEDIPADASSYDGVNLVRPMMEPDYQKREYKP